MNDTPDGYLLYAIAVRALNSHVARGAASPAEWQNYLARLRNASRDADNAADASNAAMTRSPYDPALRVAWLRAAARARITSSHYSEAKAYGADYAYEQRKRELEDLVAIHVQYIK